MQRDRRVILHIVRNPNIRYAEENMSEGKKREFSFNYLMSYMLSWHENWEGEKISRDLESEHICKGFE